MINLSKEDIQKLFTMSDAIASCKTALGLYSDGKSQTPLRTNLNVEAHNGQALFMPGYVDGENKSLGIKIVSVYPDNIKKGLPSVPATMITMDAETGIVNGMLDGTYLTQLRTGAVQGAATDLMARNDAKIAALIGTGGQAESQLEAMLTVREIEEVRVFDIDFERGQKFAEEMNHKFDTEIIAKEKCEDCVKDADIITTVTTSKVPTFSAEWVKDGAHINGIGSYTKEMCEIPKEILKKADVIIFDTMDGVLEEAGDILQPLESGYINKSQFTGELGQLVNGTIEGRKDDKNITVFKTVGSAVLDVVTANDIIKKAKQQ